MPTKSKLRFKVGDRVRLRLGARLVTGTVVEDLGNLDVGRKQLVRIEVPFTATDPQVFEVPAALLMQASRRRAAA